MEENKQEVFESYPIPKAVATLAIPTTIGMLVMVLYNMVDAYFIGLTNDAVQVAAVSLAMPIFLILMACGNLFGIGASANISRYLGEKSYDKVKTISSFSLWSAVILAIIVAILGLTFMDGLTYAIGSDDTTFEYVKGYLSWLCYGAVFIILSNTLGYLLRSEGHAKAAMVGMMISTFTNIILDPILIFICDFGVVGAAMATVIANAFAVVYFFITLARLKGSYLSIKISDYKFDSKIAKDVFSIGVPACLTTVLMSVASIIYNVYLAKYGTIPVASMGIVIKLNMLPVMMFMGLGMGVQPLFGYTYGAKIYDRLKESIIFSTKVAVTIGVVCFGIYFFAAEVAVGVFIDDAEVISQGAKMLQAQVLTAPILGILFIATNLMQVANKPLIALLLAVCRQGVTFIPAVIILDVVAGLDGLIYAQPIADVVSVVLSVLVCINFIKSLQSNLEDNIDKYEELVGDVEEVIEEAIEIEEEVLTT